MDETSTALPAMPPPRFSAFELAATLPELWEVHDQADLLKVRGKGESPEYHRAAARMEETTARLTVVEDLILETPAQTVNDVVAVLMLCHARVQIDSELDCVERSLKAVLGVLLPLATKDFSELRRHYPSAFSAKN